MWNRMLNMVNHRMITMTGLDGLQDKVLAPINWVKNILMGVVSAVGVVIFIVGLVDLVGAMSSGHKDVPQIVSAVLKMAAGLVLASIGAVVIAFTS